MPDRREIAASTGAQLWRAVGQYEKYLENLQATVAEGVTHMGEASEVWLKNAENRLEYLLATLRQVDPQAVLRRGYALVRDDNSRILRQMPAPGDEISVAIAAGEFIAKVAKTLPD